MNESEKHLNDYRPEYLNELHVPELEGPRYWNEFAGQPISTRQLSMCHGSEGPAHDPYSYTEYIVHLNGNLFILHYGLAEWFQMNDEPRIYAKKTLKWIEGARHEDVYEIDPGELFKEQTGLSTSDFEKFYYRLRSKCRNCGCTKTKGTPGHPGEYFELCTNCGYAVDYQFNESEII